MVLLSNLRDFVVINFLSCLVSPQLQIFLKMETINLILCKNSVELAQCLPSYKNEEKVLGRNKINHTPTFFYVFL